ncbi:hotdog family protein [Quatrionicoccus australiensis]|uniref:hotdog family protein n=1 Tax=Quatrionicoccus australiensis TaxID=138118 RepID=UPI001CF8335E|nr:hotdog family protein [Quatrionicoccus australiensis]
MLDHAWIAAHIPHQGDMCLLDSVVDWSENAISCRAVSHTDPANPLRAADRLGAATGIEYAAQAMAIHGALLAGQDDAPRQGYLTSVRSVTLHVDRLDDLSGPLDVQAERLSGDANNILYQFSVGHAGRCLLAGRAAVVLDAAALTKESA